MVPSIPRNSNALARKNEWNNCTNLPANGMDQIGYTMNSLKTKATHPPTHLRHHQTIHSTIFTQNGSIYYLFFCWQCSDLSGCHSHTRKKGMRIKTYHTH